MRIVMSKGNARNDSRTVAGHRANLECAAERLGALAHRSDPASRSRVRVRIEPDTIIRYDHRILLARGLDLDLDACRARMLYNVVQRLRDDAKQRDLDVRRGSLGVAGCADSDLDACAL